MRVFDAVTEARGVGGAHFRETRRSPRRIAIGDALRRLPQAIEPWITHPLGLILLMLGVALAARCAQFGNPVVHVDDQFYLFAGDRMLHGALPYVDIWDRKPIGLFLLYAGIRLLGGEGFVEYQLVATLFAAATGYAVARLARRTAAPHGAAAAGVVYILYLGLFGGEGGQSPVFYNLLTVLAAGAVLRVIERPRFDSVGFGWGLAATALMGVAIQVKYTALFEGGFFGVTLMLQAHRLGVRRGRLVAMSAAWFAAALAPTVLAWGTYAALGHGHAFVHANFESIFRRNADPAWMLVQRLAWMAAVLAPLALAAFAGHRIVIASRDAATRQAGRFVAAWALAAVLGLLVFGSYFDHYALPLLAPLAAAAAPMLGTRGAALALVAPGVRWQVPAGPALMLFAAGLSAWTINENRRERGWGPQVRDVAAFVTPRLAGGCLYVHDGDVVLYQLTGSCLPTRWPFPPHLTSWREDGAIGVDAGAEVRRILATRPSIIVEREKPSDGGIARSYALVRAELARAYVPAHRTALPHNRYVVWQRRPGM